MRCTVCDRNLKDHELVRRHGITNEFLDICDGCLREIPGLPTKTSQSFFSETTDPFEEADTEGDAIDIDSVTNCYTLNIDNEE